MTISSLDHIIEASLVLPPTLIKIGHSSGYQTGRGWSSWPMPGIPGTGVEDTTLNGVALTGPIDGAPVITNAPGGQKNYLGSISIGENHNGSVMIADRLWHNQINRASSSLQSITSPTWPARDANGSTNGEGVFIGLEVSSQLGGAGSPVSATLGYTDSDGNSGKTASSVGTLPTSALVGNVIFFPWGAGEKGVRSVQSIQLSGTYSSGLLNMFAYRAILDVQTGNAPAGVDLNYQDTGLPEVPNDVVLQVLMLSNTTSTGFITAIAQVLQR